MRFTLFMPVLNEIDGLKAIMPRIKREWVDEIIFVDGHSTDGTYEWLKENGYFVIQQRLPGCIRAYWECFDIATGDVLIPFTPDGNSIPELIPPLIEKMKLGYDLVIVSRYLQHARSDDDDHVTAFGNWMFTKLLQPPLPRALHRRAGGFKAFKLSLIKELELDVKDLPAFDVQLEIRCLKRKLRIAEIPGDEPPRIGGVRKMRPLYNGASILYIILRELFVYLRNDRLRPTKKWRATVSRDTQPHVRHDPQDVQDRGTVRALHRDRQRLDALRPPAPQESRAVQADLQG
jgi:glycosyltransferase involved in cell wall biosynthesis